MLVARTRVDEALSRLMDKIIGEDLEPGAKLPPADEFASDCGLSVVTVRQALKTVESLGLVEITHGRGIFLTEGGSVLHDLIGARRIIECYHAEIAATRRTAEQLLELKGFVRVMDEDIDSADGEAYTRHDMLFHSALGRSAGNRILLKTLQTIREVVYLQLTYVNRAVPLLRLSRKRHHEILEALENQAPEKARHAMEQHMDDVLAKYSKYAKSHQRLRRSRG